MMSCRPDTADRQGESMIECFNEVEASLVDLLLGEGWRDALSNEFNKEYFKKLELFLRKEWRQHVVYPPLPQIFR